MARRNHIGTLSSVSLSLLLSLTGCLGERVIDHSTGAMLTDPDTGERITDIPTLRDGVVVDRDVFSGTYANGTPFEGVEGAIVEIDLADRPSSWSIALLHASLITRQGSIAHSPDELLAVATIESKLDCASSDCFGVTKSSHITPLAQHIPERFDKELDTTNAFALSALLYAYSQILSTGLWTRLLDAPETWMSTHSDPLATPKALYLAHQLSPYHDIFSTMFERCGEEELAACLSAQGSMNHFQLERARMLGAITSALKSEGRAASVRVSREELEDYLDQIAPLYPERDEEGLARALDISFASASALETQEALARAILALHGHLGDPLTLDEMRRALCFSNVLSNQTCATILAGGSNQ